MSNPNSSIEFFKRNLNNIPSLINELKQALEDLNTPIKSENLFLFINVLYEVCLKENLLDEYLKAVATQENSPQVQEVRNQIVALLSEEKENIFNYMKEYNKRKKNTYLNLTKMEYKFIGLCGANDLDRGNINPKLLITLYFNDGSEQLIESSFASFKKLQEEIENTLSAFKSSYSRRIQVFAK